MGSMGTVWGCGDSVGDSGTIAATVKGTPGPLGVTRAASPQLGLSQPRSIWERHPGAAGTGTLPTLAVDMSTAKRREEALDLMEQACMLCGQAAADLVLWGQKVEQEELCAHLFCLIFASKLRYWQDEESGQRRFIPEDIACIVERVVDKQCFICGESGAAITCCWEGCDRSFHLPCAIAGECVTQYFLPHRSFCREHRPEQEVGAAPEKTNCLICLEPVEDGKSFHTLVCPVCREAWFHRGCIQGQAQYAGSISFKCPLCRDKYNFLHGMLTMGIRIPVRLPSWDNRPLGEARMERHSCCNTRQCLCPGGREQAEEQGPWELLLCSSCAAEGTHRRCANLSTSRSTWECGPCAGQGTASSDCSELAGSGTGSPSGPGSSQGSPVPQSSSPSPASQLPAESCPSPALEGSSSSRRGPVRRRDSSRLERRAQNPYSRPGRRHETSRVPSPHAASSDCSELAGSGTGSPSGPGSSQGSPVPQSSSPSPASQLPAESCPSPALEGSSSSRRGPVRRRDSSRLERRAQNPYSRPGRRHETSRVPSPHAGPDPPPMAQ
ncbi:PHD finger protein 7-like [Athene cunicularia]|uniref:PHD finger protein 7-like n=1 Tax=Athene cunicularia TaxID=194338 RepID=UPI000EF6CFDD|nr:PHD finger protein 7-like [Athene cunicularia]